VTHDLETVTTELAEVYESQARVQPFAELLEHGCGPGCGTEAASGQGCSNCGAGCAVAQACGKSH
ncbi:MAG TPA: hypothetical protein VG713_00185, partial [Pirellulales bacterium]|nr:hypothetical protein [Pirellulales bacterium]